MIMNLRHAVFVAVVAIASGSVASKSSSISGTVRDNSGLPVADAEVYALPLTASVHRLVPFSHSDNAGKRAFAQLPSGTYTVFAAQPAADHPPTGFSAIYSNNGMQHQLVALTPEHPQAGITLSLGPSAALLYGRFIDQR